MLLIVGLGNPGSEYAGHRHNVGALAVDVIHDHHRFGPWRKRFSALLADGEFAGEKTLLMKPLTFMNESGRAVGEAARFYKITPADVVVIHDELDLAPGKTRIKAGGGSAGHNGLRSVTAHIGNDYRRLRIGIGHPGHRAAVNRHVLHDFAKADSVWLIPLLDAIAENAPLLAGDKDSLFVNRLHLATNGEPGTKPAKQKNIHVDNAVAKNTNSDPEAAKGPFSGLRRLFTGK